MSSEPNPYQSPPAPPSIPLILLPGMAADARLFAPQQAVFKQLVVPRWLDPEPHEPLPHYAQRMARAVDPGGPCFLGGISLGGMIAMEMCPYLSAKACLLVASIRTPSELPPRLRMLGSLTGTLPSLAGRVPGLTGRLLLALGGNRLAPMLRSAFSQAVEANPQFVGWAIGAVAQWKRSFVEPPVPVAQIHGDRDPVLPHRLTHPDVLIPGGGHLLTITHPLEVNYFLRTQMAKYGG